MPKEPYSNVDITYNNIAGRYLLDNVDTCCITSDTVKTRIKDPLFFEVRLKWFLYVYTVYILGVLVSV